MKKGIDVSEHQGVIDWQKVKPQIDFAMIRAGYGRNNIDKQFVRNIAECNRLGIPCGIYWFSYALSVEDAENEAKYCLAAIKPYKVEYPVCFDFEYDSVTYATKNRVIITKETASAMVMKFCSAVEAAGYYAMNYTNSDFLTRYFNGDTTARFDLWLASWPKAPDFNKPPKACGIWQWGGKAYDGISGTVDSNVSYKDYVQYTTVKVETPTVETVCTIELTKTNASALQSLLANKGIAINIKEVK